MSSIDMPFIPQPEPLAMRNFAGRFLTGVAIVTADNGQEHVGMTINSLSSISLEPPILMISLNFGTRTLEAVEMSNAFGISILSVRQEPVARQFSTRGGPRFEVGKFDTAPSGLPLVSDALAQFDCAVVEKLTVGDHRVFFGQVDHARGRNGEGLLFKAGQFGEFKDSKSEAALWLA